MARPPIHCITFSDPGGGKSTFACTWPKPILVFIFDPLGKDFPYLKWARSVGAELIESLDAWGTRVTEIVLNGELLMRLEYYNDISPQSNSWELFTWRMRERTFWDEGWATIVFDSVTFAEICARMFARHVVNPGTKEPRQWFAFSTDALEYALLVQLGAFPGNLLVLAHVSSDKDETLGMFLRQISAPGRLKEKNELAAGYSELYLAYLVVDGGETLFCLQTRRDNIYHCATQIDAPNPCWQDYEALWENFG